MQDISSRDNPRVRHLRKLVESSRERRTCGETVLDGAHLLAAALDAGVPLLEVWFAESRLETPEFAMLRGRLHDVPTYRVPDALLAGLSPVDAPSGVLARIAIPAAAKGPHETADWLVLDGVQDAGNVGTMLRTAAAAGLKDVVLGKGCAQAWSPRVLRAGMGAQFHLRIHEHVELGACLATYGGRVAITRLDAATSLYALDLRDPVAWVFGAEGQGVSAEMRERADLGVIVPMAAGIESLNVAACAAVCLFEQRRQRGA